MNNLGNAYRHQKKFDEAKIYIDLCYQKRKLSLGENHPFTLTTMVDVAILTSILGPSAIAVVMFDDCIKKHIAILGENHPQTMYVKSNQLYYCPVLTNPVIKSLLSSSEAKTDA
jgi:hypothetical protein